MEQRFCDFHTLARTYTHTTTKSKSDFNYQTKRICTLTDKGKFRDRAQLESDKRSRESKKNASGRVSETNRMREGDSWRTEGKNNRKERGRRDDGDKRCLTRK